MRFIFDTSKRPPVRYGQLKTMFNQLIPGFFSLVGLLTSIVWLFLFNWILERKFHRFDALIARAFGILLSKGMTNDEKVKLATPLLKQIKEFN